MRTELVQSEPNLLRFFFIFFSGKGKKHMKDTFIRWVSREEIEFSTSARDQHTIVFNLQPVNPKKYLIYSG